MDRYLELAQQYDAGNFDYNFLVKSGFLSSSVDRQGFEKRNQNFHQNFDDWYREYYAKYGDRREEINAKRALMAYLTSVNLKTFEHMDTVYMNCAISSGPDPHLDAVEWGHHTTDKLDTVIGGDRHKNRNVIPASHRSFARAYLVQPLWPEGYIITPSSFEGTTRVLHTGTEIIYGDALESADYMSGWNPRIDFCKGFILDDPTIDLPRHDQIEQELKLAKAHSPLGRPRKPIVTTAWLDSRNSVFETARGVYVAFGLHPLRPDNKMDMRIYSGERHELRPATLLDCALPIAQSILRWAPQGIAADTACQTLARFFNLHRMRIDPVYNGKQASPLDLAGVNPVFAKPSKEEVKAFAQLEGLMKPFLLKYCAHLMKPNGIPEDYAAELHSSPLSRKDIGQKSMKWQIKNIPFADSMTIWDLTCDLQKKMKPNPAYPQRTPYAGTIAPQRRKHDFKNGIFDDTQPLEIWKDRPYDALSQMMKDAATMTIGVLETGILPLDAPYFHGYRADMKRGVVGISESEKQRVQDLSLLPGAMGKDFKRKVLAPNRVHACEIVEGLKKGQDSSGLQFPMLALGSQDYKVFSDNLTIVSQKFAGPGFDANSDFRLALEMAMLRRNYTHIHFADGWEASEDSARLMLQATKIELGKVKRPGANDTELNVVDESGNYISLFDRYSKLKDYLSKVVRDPQVVKYLDEGNSEALQHLGLRQVSLALARIVEIYDGLIDPLFNQGRFELQQVRDQQGFSRDLHKIQETRHETIKDLCKKWAWLWTPQDLKDLRQDYSDAWYKVHGRQNLNAGPFSTDDEAIVVRSLNL